MTPKGYIANLQWFFRQNYHPFLCLKWTALICPVRIKESGAETIFDSISGNVPTIL
jgi:hypothetical protein